MKKVLYFFVPLLLVTTVVQSADLEDVSARVNRMEYRLSSMEKKLFNVNELKDDGNTTFSDFELRLQELEKENQTLYGSVEQLGYAVEKLAKRVQDMNDDVILRLQDIEKYIDNASKNGALTKGDFSGKKSESDDVINQDQSKGELTTVFGKASSTSDIPEDISVEKMYRTAYKALSSADYDKSKQWFQELTKRFPKEELTENAYYWLGEIYMVEQNPTSAVVELKNGLTHFPEGKKAPAYLLKMGEAFVQLDKEHHAKSVWEKLQKDYPNSTESQKASKLLEALQQKKPN